MNEEKITFEVKSLKTIETGLEKGKTSQEQKDSHMVDIEKESEVCGKKFHILTLTAKDLPNFSEWREINVRDPKMKSAVVRKIRNTLDQEPEQFIFRNRGLTIIAEHLTFDNKKNEVSLVLRNKELHGLLDGGHTYEALDEYKRAMYEDGSIEDKPDLEKVFVKIEVLTGFNDENEISVIKNIVEARNTATPVKEQSIADFAKAFQSIKDELKNEKYFDDVFFSEHELKENGSAKTIDIKEILSYLICFDQKNFANDSHPVIAYSSKSQVLNFFKDKKEEMEKLSVILKDILYWRDLLVLEFPGIYNRTTKGKFGRLQGVKDYGTKRIVLDFIGKKTEYVFPLGFLYPILAVFRVFVEEVNGRYKLELDEKSFKKSLELIAPIFKDYALELRNPTKQGKFRPFWESCYNRISLAKIKKELNN